MPHFDVNAASDSKSNASHEFSDVFLEKHLVAKLSYFLPTPNP